MMKQGILISMLLALAVQVSSAEHGPEGRVFAMTRAETADAVGEWLRKSGFAVSSSMRGADTAEVRGIKGEEEWRVQVRPRSPLAAEVKATYFLDGTEKQEQVQNLWNFLAGYSKGSSAQVDASLSGIPEAVLLKTMLTVCIRATQAGGPLQFSGFVIDTEGLILCTAHNLKDIRKVDVTLPGGQTLPGRIVRLDLDRDLALVRVDMVFDKVVSIAGNRKTVVMGERLFSVGCPEGLKGTVYQGVVNSPPRLASRRLLWQVGMQVYPGSSGSPVFDAEGKFAAVVKGRRRGTDSVGYLIPHETVMEFMRDAGK